MWQSLGGWEVDGDVHCHGGMLGFLSQLEEWTCCNSFGAASREVSLTVFATIGEPNSLEHLSILQGGMHACSG
jgi:hypothetical protein